MVPVLSGVKLTERDIAAVERHRLLIGAIRARIADKKRRRADPSWESEVWDFSFPDGPFDEHHRNNELATAVARQLGALQASFDLRYRNEQKFREEADSYERRGEIGENWVTGRCPPVSPSSPNWVFDAKIFQFRRPKNGEGAGVGFGDVLELWLQAVRERHIIYETAKIPYGGGLCRDVKISQGVNKTTFPKGPGMINVP